jgi:hypothetical protein
MPDLLRLLDIASSPNGDSAAALVASAAATSIGTTPFTEWRYRPLLRELREPPVATLSWARDGYVSFARWDGAARTPMLVRVNAGHDATLAESPERVMALPERCTVQWRACRGSRDDADYAPYEAAVEREPVTP